MAASRKAKKKPTKKKSKARKVPPVPKGMHTLTTSLCFKDCAVALAFYKRAFGAKELYRLTEPGGGKIGHAEMMVGDSLVMMSDEYPEMQALSAQTMNGSPIKLTIAVKNPDAAFAKAVNAGATVVRAMADQFYGWRSGTVMDPFGYTWSIACQIEQISAKQMQKKWDAMMAGGQS